MGYRKIENLYKPAASTAILGLEECYALEKIHGTSAHVGWKVDGGFFYYQGGIKESAFLEMIDERFPKLRVDLAAALNFVGDSSIKEITFYGEAYGGNCQKMASVYGPLNFIVFEVKINDMWLEVPKANLWAKCVGLPFVYYEKGPATLEFLDKMRDMPSVQAQRNGMGDDKIGEGIVVRATDESLRDRFGNRIIAKHKRKEFRETKTPREVDPEKQKIFRAAQETAEEFVVPMRLAHVVDKLVASKPGFEFDMKNTRTVIAAMIADVKKEEGDTIEWSKPIQNAIGTRTAKLWRDFVEEKLHENA